MASLSYRFQNHHQSLLAYQNLNQNHAEHLGDILVTCRDHPDHGVPMLGGMWGWRSGRESRPDWESVWKLLLRWFNPQTPKINFLAHGQRSFGKSTSFWMGPWSNPAEVYFDHHGGIVNSGADYNHQALHLALGSQGLPESWLFPLLQVFKDKTFSNEKDSST